jgi:putative SOS response-associated peptidase YedK
MCNLYSYTKGQTAIRELAEAMRDTTGNLPPLPGIFPDAMAPVVRTARDGAREITMMQWGFPCPPAAGNRPVTNIRNLSSPYWRGWLKAPFRCLVPATSFCEWADTKPKKTPTWFALDDSRPVFFFAGLWRPWTGTRKGMDGEHLLFSFLTTEANAEVAQVHPKAMPVVLASREEARAWLTAPVEDALSLQRPPPDGTLRVVATGTTEDSETLLMPGL